ncbi:MAG: alpha-hydroxy-acid oxidizing protein [Atopobiaceae bacterium]|jgi:isopentenyl diphosphate isomerase/L-lactate dehydrogenase-like FMN-dependent dehydrogenase
MEYAEVLKAARGNVGPHCQACPVCDGRACGAHIPGPGSRDGIASRNHDAWGSILLNMDTISGASDPDTSVGLFGRRLSLPLMAAPIGAISNHFGPSMGDAEYAEALVSGCAEAGIVAFTGDGLGERMFRDGVDAIARAGGVGIPTIKPWAEDEVRSKMSDALSGGAMAVAMDIDAAGLPFLRTSDVASGPKTVAELSRFVGMAHGVPFVVKGVMCAAGAEKAIEAGASAIVVSNHGGRVLGSCPATAEVLPEVADAVAGRVPVLVDGGIRSGADIFKALALGASAALVCRPFAVVVHGAGREGIASYVRKLSSELWETMQMCGAETVSGITRDMVRRP